MGRKKKVEEEPEEDDTTFETILHSDAKRSIIAVFLFALSVLFLLGFFHSAGILGTWLDTGLGMMFGWGKWLFPLLLVIAGLMFLKGRKTTLSDAIKFIGLVTSFFSVLGLFHLFSGDTSKALLEVARDGQGGGYIGFLFAALLLRFTGVLAGTIILLTFFVIGVIASFNVSLIASFERLQKKILPKKEEEEETNEEVLSSETSPLVGDAKAGDTPTEPVKEGKESKERETETEKENVSEKQNTPELNKNNISNFEFREPETTLIKTFVPRPPKKKKNGRSQRELPDVSLLENSDTYPVSGDIERKKKIIQETLKHFGIDVEPGETRIGPTVTKYTFIPASGVKLSRITALSDNLALALSAKSIRIEAPIPGQALIGIEVPNESQAILSLRAMIESDKFKSRKSDLMVVLGKDVNGNEIIENLAKMPHILIAGRTGSGKSVCMNTFLLSLLFQNTAEELKLILIDPKRVSFARYRGIPHLKANVIVENKKVINVLRWAVNEMDHRYKVLEDAKVQDIKSYHDIIAEGKKNKVVNVETGTVTEEDYAPMPYIVIMIDEMADLMVTHQKEVEPLIVRLASLSRAIGIHLVLATQRPEATVITGLIKANIPARISFQLKSQIDSRTILDTGGAEKLLGNGDMLYSAADGKEIRRVQGVLVSDKEIKSVISFLIEQEKTCKDELEEDGIDGLEDESDISQAINALDEGAKEDALYEQAKTMTIQSGKASTTSFQTAFSVGYPRAARLMRLLEENGVVGMVDGKKTVLIGKESLVSGSAEEENQNDDDPLREQSERDKWQF